MSTTLQSINRGTSLAWVANSGKTLLVLSNVLMLKRGFAKAHYKLPSCSQWNSLRVEFQGLFKGDSPGSSSGPCRIYCTERSLLICGCGSTASLLLLKMSPGVLPPEIPLGCGRKNYDKKLKLQSFFRKALLPFWAGVLFFLEQDDATFPLWSIYQFTFRTSVLVWPSTSSVGGICLLVAREHQRFHHGYFFCWPGLIHHDSLTHYVSLTRSPVKVLMCLRDSLWILIFQCHFKSYDGESMTVPMTWVWNARPSHYTLYTPRTYTLWVFIAHTR